MFLSKTFLIITIIVLLSVVLFLLYKLYKFSIIILNLETSVEECLDVLDSHYKKMNEVIQKPVFFDSIEVRQVINDIKQCHNAVLLVANRLTSDSGIQGEIKKEDSEKE